MSVKLALILKIIDMYSCVFKNQYSNLHSANAQLCTCNRQSFGHSKLKSSNVQLLTVLVAFCEQLNSYKLVRALLSAASMLSLPFALGSQTLEYYDRISCLSWAHSAIWLSSFFKLLMIFTSCALPLGMVAYIYFAIFLMWCSGRYGTTVILKLQRTCDEILQISTLKFKRTVGKQTCLIGSTHCVLPTTDHPDCQSVQ